MNKIYLVVFSLILFSCADAGGTEEVFPLIMGLFGILLLWTIGLFIKVVIIDNLIKKLFKKWISKSK